jgi:hypothetical protein
MTHFSVNALIALAVNLIALGSLSVTTGIVYIQFEIPRLAAKRNRRVAADGMSRDLDDRFTNFYASQPSYLLPWTAGPSHVRY